MEPIKNIKGRVLPLLIDDIDTDRIIPARFLRCITFDGIGEFAFFDERFDTDGKAKDFPMNKDVFRGTSIILSLNNFGCGSSREHAPQSIKRAGYKAVIAESFAEIFFGNSLTIGLVCVMMSREDILDLSGKIVAHPDRSVEISLDKMKAVFMDDEYDIYIPETARQAFVSGTYDLLAELLRNADKTKKVAESLTY